MSFEFSADQPCRVLIADRSPGVRSLVRRVLECAGAVFIIDEADSVQSVSKRTSENPVHLAYISDNIGPSDSLDVIKAMATKWHGLRAVLMTEKITAELLTNGRHAGVGTFLTKPFYPAQVEHAFDLLFEELENRSFEPLTITDLEQEMAPVTPDDAEYTDFRKALAG